MDCDVQIVESETQVVSADPRDIGQIIREECATQTYEIVLALSKELDSVANLITNSIKSELYHFQKDMIIGTDDRLGPQEAELQGAQKAQHLRPSLQYNLMSTDTDNTPDRTETISHGVEIIEAEASQKTLETTVSQTVTKQCSRSPSILQMIHEQQLGEIRHGSLAQSKFSWRIRECLHSNVAERILAMLIISNAALFGLRADHAIAHPYVDPPRYLEVVEWVFTIIFSFELCFRLVADGLMFFSCKHPEFNWNCLDFALVALAYLEVFLVSINVNLFSARLLRMLRMVRMIKLLRVLRDMRLMVFSILVSFRPLLWAMMLLGLIIYTFAIVLLQLIQSDIADISHTSHYKSLFHLMFSLFMCISGGVSWIEVVEPIWHIHPVIPLLFGAYISFAVFCVLNIVTGFFCDQASRMSQEDEENLMIEEIQSRKKWMADIEAVFRQADENGNGELSQEEFLHCLRDLKVQTALKACGVDLMRMSILHVFDMLDFDQSGKVDCSEFAVGLQHIHGDAKAIDIARVKHELRNVHSKLNKIIRFQEEHPPGPSTRSPVRSGRSTQPTSIESRGLRVNFKAQSTPCESACSVIGSQPLPALPAAQPTPALEGKGRVVVRLMPVSASRAAAIGSRSTSDVGTKGCDEIPNCA